MMSRLFEPKTLRDLTISNRFVVSPMCQYMAETGAANSWHTAHLTSMALSGAGLLILEATAVEPEGRITPGCLGLWDNATEEALAASLAVVRKYSPIAIGMQLAHAGRKASCEVPWKGGASIPPDSGGWLPFAPSPVAFKEGDTKPEELDRAGLDRVKNAFVAAAGRAVRLGLDALELHSAHGYLLHNFLSPLSNLRTDEYGGSLENRMRYPLEVYDAVRKAVPAGIPLGVKISATDWVDGGWDLDQSVIYANELKKRDVDWITASSGGTSPLQQISVGPGYQVPFASRIKREVDVAVMAVGLITQASKAEKVLADGDADLVALARGLLYDPRWGWHAAAELGATIFAPPPYLRAAPHEHKNLFG